MRLAQARIQNFMGIENRELAFKPGFNLIKGKNGAGKTSVIEALAAGLGAFPNAFSSRPAGTFVKKNFSQSMLRKEYARSGDASCAFHYRFPLEISLTAELAAAQGGTRTVSWTRSKKEEPAKYPFQGTLDPQEISKLARESANQPETCLPVLNYQGIGRILTSRREQNGFRVLLRKDRTSGYDNALSGFTNIDRIVEWFVSMEQVAWQKEQKIAEYEAVKQAAAAFMERMENAENYRLFYDKQLQELMYQGGNILMPVFDLSDGYRSLVLIVLDIAYRMAQLNPFLLENIAQTRGVVLIDELDLSLHPQWQWRVIDALRDTFPNVQFIATTHAPILFASAKDVWIIDVEKEETGYSYSRYGLDVNTAVTEYQGVSDLPEEVRQQADAVSDAMDAEEYPKAKALLERLENTLDTKNLPEPPIVAGLRARYDIEMAWPED